MGMTTTRKLGDAEVFPIGLGGMPMSLSGRPPEEQSIRAIHAALDAGVNLIDTADAYSADASDFGHNERLIAKALRGRRDDVIVATKGGHTRTADGAWELDGRPEYVKRACASSSSETFETPTWRILPSSWSSLSAPTESSYGTCGSGECS